MTLRRALQLLIIFVAGSPLLAQGSPHTFIQVKLAATAKTLVSGRLIVFMKLGAGDVNLDSEESAPNEVWVAARDVQDLAPGASVEIDADETAFPKPFSSMPAGDWEAQALLDVDGSYNYFGRGVTNWVGPVKEFPRFIPGESSELELTLDTHPAEETVLTEARTHIKDGEIERMECKSTALTRFWGRPVSINSYVVLPPGYTAHSANKYPTAYWTAGFGGNLDYALIKGEALRTRMVAGKMPPMIWIMLDESLPEGTHEFADSVNDGPWGAALVGECIPEMERKYRMDARPSGRLLTGHSSGGWATLQLEINHPDIFGGTWSTAPDPVDLHDFVGVDLYLPGANLYRRPDQTAYPWMRQNGKVVATIEQLAKREAVIGPYGGQFASFEWVFSPKGDSGRPMPLFDRVTGAVNPEVVPVWAAHGDLANLAERVWPEYGKLLVGRIHLFVGTEDTFYLEGPVRLFEDRLAKLGAGAHFTYLPGRTHTSVYWVGSDHNALFDQIGAEMYAVARPGTQ